MSVQPKIGLALGGGFFRGLAHIGVLRVLEDNNIAVHMICGTSIGAVVGSVYACGMPLKRLEQLAVSVNERMFYDLGIPRKGMLRGDKITDFMRTVTGNRDFDQTDIPFRAVACDIETGEKLVLSQGKIYQAVRASLSVPGVFVPVEMDGRVMVDGGVVCRVPSQETRAMGADVVIAVDVGARQGRFEVSNTLDIIVRTFEIMEYQAMRGTEDADVIITPQVNHINMTRLTQAAECVDLGVQAALSALPDIKKAVQKAARRVKRVNAPKD